MAMKTYVVGTHQKCLIKVFLMSTHDIFFSFAEVLLMSIYKFSWRSKKSISNFQMKIKKLTSLELSVIIINTLGRLTLKAPSKIVVDDMKCQALFSLKNTQKNNQNVIYCSCV